MQYVLVRTTASTNEFQDPGYKNLSEGHIHEFKYLFEQEFDDVLTALIETSYLFYLYKILRSQIYFLMPLPLFYLRTFFVYYCVLSIYSSGPSLATRDKLDSFWNLLDSNFTLYDVCLLKADLYKFLLSILEPSLRCKNFKHFVAIRTDDSVWQY